ncbi:hypothetical protein FNF27_02436 [Cafeteria roenbergensis]|uniref:Uncharacterized protein n=1 Tax=Cafeteria roenbergensis TaxID=33653 RepID=A0A5A8EFM2_CAFRO|nr:hypothetical protein FNF27_02436 [Cafeteria roenbergensis]
MSPGAHLPVTVSGLHDCDLFTRTAAAIASKLGVECIHNADAAGPSVALGGISRAPPTLEQLSADKELLAKWTSKADRGPPGDLLVALSEAASVFAGILLKPAPPAQKALRPQAKALLNRVEALVEGRGTTGTAEWTAAEVGAAAAVLLWLAPAASHCRWFKVMDKPGSFPLCSAVAADINRMLAAAGLEMPRSAFVAHLAKPSVVPRPPALGVGRMQHGAMRSQMATCHASAEAILAEIDAFADGKAPLPPLDKVDKLARLFGHFVVVIDAHSVMEDDLIYHELERAFPGCTALHTIEHVNEVPEFRAIHRRLLAAAEALRALLPSSDESASAAAEAGDVRVAVDEAKKAHSAALEAAVEHRAAMAKQAEAVAAQAKSDAAARAAEGDADAAAGASAAAAPAPADAPATRSESPAGVAGSSDVDASASTSEAAPALAASLAQATAALWAACAQVRQCRDDVEDHFVGEETNLFPRLQKLPPPVRKATAGKCLALLKATHEEVLPALLAAMNPAQADHYVHVIRSLGGLSEDEWTALVASLRAGVAAGDMSQAQLDALAARSGPVRATLATLVATEKEKPRPAQGSSAAA